MAAGCSSTATAGAVALGARISAQLPCEAIRAQQAEDLRLGLYSLRMLDELRRETHIDYGGSATGTLPIIGPTHIANLRVNTGHGHLGWTLAAGSGRLLADLLCESEPGVDPDAYALSRFG